MSHLYFLVGPPGSGKRTVGKELAALTGAALLDNHIWNDPIFSAYGVDGRSDVPEEVFELSGQVRQLVLRAVQIAPRGRAHILTSYLSDGEDAALAQVRTLAQERGVVFVPVWLTCGLPELERRMTLPERAERLKLRDPELLRGLLAEHGQLAPPSDAIRLDTAAIGARDAALLIAAHAGVLF